VPGVFWSRGHHPQLSRCSPLLLTASPFLANIGLLTWTVTNPNQLRVNGNRRNARNEMSLVDVASALGFSALHIGHIACCISCTLLLLCRSTILKALRPLLFSDSVCECSKMTCPQRCSHTQMHHALCPSNIRYLFVSTLISMHS
jgi:hypothetical protein